MFGFERTWLQVLPAVVAFVWVVTRWSRYRTRWDWAQQMPALALGSFIGAQYEWGFDQPVVMIAAVRAGVSLEKRPQRVIVAVFVLANIVMAVMIFAGLTDSWLLWSLPLWAVLYARAIRSNSPHAIPISKLAGN